LATLQLGYLGDSKLLCPVWQARNTQYFSLLPPPELDVKMDYAVVAMWGNMYYVIFFSAFLQQYFLYDGSEASLYEAVPAKT